MTRLLVLLVGASIVAGVTATGATAVRHAVPAAPHVTLVGSAATIAPTDTLTLHGSYTIGLPMVGAAVTVTQYDTPACPTPATAHVAHTYSTTTSWHGSYGIDVSGLAVGPHSFLATANWHGWHGAASTCLTVSVVAAPPVPHVTLAVSATTVAAPATPYLHGTYTIGDPMVGAGVTVTQYDTPTCPTPTNAHVARTYSTTTGAHGLYGVTVRDLAVGQHSFLATANWHGWHGATSSCLTITVVAAPKPPPEPPVPPEPPIPPLPPQLPEPVAPVLPSSYLCWNREMVNPVVYMDREADTMWTLGAYLEPKAILGNVEGGTNIGAYHLVCNAPSTLRPTGEAVGGSGEVYSQSVLNAYHVDHPVNGNDLNVYHIYK